MTEDVKKERKTLSKMNAEELKAAFEKKKKELAEIEAKLHGTGLNEAIVKHKALEAFKNVKAEMKDVNELLILKAIGEAAGIKRLVVEQEAVKPRAKKNKA